jgi:hypothetical protein
LGINSWIDIGIMFVLMSNFKILANDHFLLFFFKFEFEAIIFVSCGII